MIQLVMQNLTIGYGSHVVVPNLSLEIEKGELFALLGPSGSGKSTLLMALAGFVPLMSGRIIVAGEDISRLAPNRRGIGLVFQSFALFPHKTVYENIAYSLRVRGDAESVRRASVAEIVKIMHLEGVEHRLPSEISGGQQQRVALARALVFKPRLLLLDEPLGSLDKELREELQFEIRRLQHQINATTIYVTHDQSEAMSIADRIGVLRDGTLEQIGAPQDIYACPSSPFVARFVGGANLLNARILSMDGATCRIEASRMTLEGVARPDWLSVSRAAEN